MKYRKDLNKFELARATLPKQEGVTVAQMAIA